MRVFIPLRRSRLARLTAITSLAALGAAAGGAAPASAATTTASVSVAVNQTLSTFPNLGSGVNTAVYDTNMNDSTIPGMISDAGIKAMRYPGGSYADAYHWKTNTVDGGFVAPNTDFDAFMATVRAADAQPIITADYGSGTPEEAAAWVKYANVVKHYGVKYWEIGNEIPGNGEYGATWEVDKHSSHSATTYANNLLQFASAMKAVDPTIKIGAVLCTPDSWPDGVVGPGDTMDWNDTVLSIAGPKIDFAIVHYYPGTSSSSEAAMLATPSQQIPTMMSAVHSLINKWAGANARHVGVAITETNGTIDSDVAPEALFAADDYVTLMENGVFNVDYWDMHNGTDCSKVTTIDGATDYNDGGILSSGAACEPPANTPFAPYFGIAMVSKLGSCGDELVPVSSSNPLLIAHAARRANGQVNVMLINEDPNNSVTVSLFRNGDHAYSGTATVYSYLKNATSITETKGSAASQTVPPYSIVVVQIHR